MMKKGYAKTGLAVLAALILFAVLKDRELLQAVRILLGVTLAVILALFFWIKVSIYQKEQEKEEKR